MKKRIILITILSLITIWSIFFITDSTRCKNDKEPIFSIQVNIAKDGGSIHYVGLFYNYYRVRKYEIVQGKEDLELLTDYVITPWFYSLDYAKEKVFG